MMIDRQWKLVNEQHGGVNATDLILNGVYRKKTDTFVCRIIHSFASLFTYIICLNYGNRYLTHNLTSVLCNKSDQLPQHLVNTQPHFTLFHYNSLISLSGILQQDHRGRLYIVALPHHTQENQFLIRTLSFFLNMERNVFD